MTDSQREQSGVVRLDREIKEIIQEREMVTVNQVIRIVASGTGTDEERVMRMLRDLEANGVLYLVGEAGTAEVRLT